MISYPRRNTLLSPRLAVPLFLAGLALTLAPAGCGPQIGSALYFMGAGHLYKIEAEYEFGEAPVLILVDDLQGHLTWPQARDVLAEQIGKQLLKNEAATKIISPRTLRRFRRTHADLDDIPCNKLGRMLGAEEVLWVEIKAFYAEEEFHDTAQAAAVTVAVRVIDATEKENARKVRVYPTNSEGKPVSADLTANEAGRLRAKGKIAAALCEKLADKVAKLFYKHSFQEAEEQD